MTDDLTDGQRRRIDELQERHRRLRYRAAAHVESEYATIFAEPFDARDLQAVCAEILWYANKSDFVLGGSRPEFWDVRESVWTAYNALGNATGPVSDDVYERVRMALRLALERLGDLDIALAAHLQRHWD